MVGRALLALIATATAASLLARGEFVINAKNDDGNVVREVIQENVDEQYITLEYTDWDLTRVGQLIDARNGFSIYRLTLFGELDLGQPAVDTLCFVSHMAASDFIEPESVSKLRQKNQDAIRRGETNLGLHTSDVDLEVDFDKSDLLSPHIRTFCKLAKRSIYTTRHDLSRTAEVYHRSLDELLKATVAAATGPQSRCHETAAAAEPCRCYYKFSISWYPCSLRYCKSADTANNKPSYYKCGINTCGQTRLYRFSVAGRARCWWEAYQPFKDD